MEDRRISYSSGNFSSIDRVEPGDPDRFANEDSTRPEARAPEAVQAQAKSGKVKPIRRPASKDAKSKAGAGLLGRAGRRQARIRDVENLGTASAAARELSPGRAVAQTHAQKPAGSPELSGDGPSPAIANRNDSQGGDGRTPVNPAAAEGDAAAVNVTAALDAVEAADAPAGSEPAPVIADRAGGPAETGFGFTMSEDAVPLEVADLDEASGGGLDLAEFVIQAAVFGDDDGAIRIPWAPENTTAKGKRAAPDLADRPQKPDGRADRARGSGGTLPASLPGRRATTRGKASPPARPRAGSPRSMTSTTTPARAPQTPRIRRRSPATPQITGMSAQTCEYRSSTKTIFSRYEPPTSMKQPNRPAPKATPRSGRAKRRPARKRRCPPLLRSRQSGRRNPSSAPANRTSSRRP